jgi:quercetin dioxygenase-like cupin family protein
MSDKPYLFIPDLAGEVKQIPTDSILSRQILTTPQAKVTLFGFDTGQELTEHTAAWPAILYFAKGDADLTLGGDHYEVHAGSWAHMPARLPHALVAKSPLTMLLIMLVGEGEGVKGE